MSEKYYILKITPSQSSVGEYIADQHDEFYESLGLLLDDIDQTFATEIKASNREEWEDWAENIVEVTHGPRIDRLYAYIENGEPRYFGVRVVGGNARQQQYRAKNRKQLGIDASPEEIDAFREACKERGDRPTTLIRGWMAEYVNRK